MSDLIDTTEMYLKTIFELEEDGVTPLRARIVERLGHSGPTVSQTVGRMERDGLVHVMGDRRLELRALAHRCHRFGLGMYARGSVPLGTCHVGPS